MAVLLGGLHQGPGPLAAALASETPSPFTPASADASLAERWADIVDLLGGTRPASRRVLLGARDPDGPSCVEDRAAFAFHMHPDGGPGTRLAYLYGQSEPRRGSPLADFRWYQDVLRRYSETVHRRNRAVYPRALRLADETADLARALAEAPAWPDGLQPAEVATAADRLGRWSARLDEAIASRRLSDARRAAAELASAAASLADLHRWLDLLTANLLAQLEFQARCRPVFTAWNDRLDVPYRPQQHISGFPGGRAWVTVNQNLLEVEHQAEWLFASAPPVPAGADTEAASAGAAGAGVAAGVEPLAAVPAAVWLPPALRPTFLRLREGLGPDARRAWDHAARAPYHHAYLANMLFHIRRSDGEDVVAEVLARYQAAHPEPATADLMDVLFYRGGDPDGGEAWRDRFHPQLLAAAATLAGTREQVLLGAQHYTRAVFGGWRRYGKTGSVEVALTEGRFDCIGATDIIGSLYRNAGRPRFYNVHLAAGGGSHTLAAAAVDTAGGPAVAVVDGLDAAGLEAARWPDAFFHDGAGWPAGYTGPAPPVQAAELYTRGIDSYLWLEGYILRGPRAGYFRAATVPYLASHPRPTAARLRRAVSDRRGAASGP